MKSILYFLEDRAHETFITALVERLAKEEGAEVQSDVRSARGGRGRVFEELKSLAGNIRRSKGEAPPFDVLVAAIDGNCNRADTQRRVRETVQGVGVETRLVTCIPDPHIERWYLLDLGALRKAVGSDVDVEVPGYKCEKALYKDILAEAVKPLGSLLGGPEYGDSIARNIDYRVAGHPLHGDKAFAGFLEELRRHLKG